MTATGGIQLPRLHRRKSVQQLDRGNLAARYSDWSEVGIHDNFFEVGGHSMLLVQMHRKLVTAFDRQLSVAEVFQFPTVATMAAHLGGAADDSPDNAAEDRAAKRRAGAERQRRRRERRK